MKILTAQQMQAVDRRATERFAIPSLILMENAAIAVVDAIFEHAPTCERVAIFCGTGANGGDGLAVARHLENRGVVPSIFIAGDRGKFKGDAETNLRICERLALPIYDIVDAESLDEALVRAAEADIVVDALFGTGLERAPEGIYAEVVRAINELTRPVVALGLPSGANAARGAIRTGAGLVTVITDRPTAPVVHAHSIESMTSLDDAAMAGKDAVLIGPGLRDDDDSYARIRAQVERIDAPLVIDASGLNAFA